MATLTNSACKRQEIYPYSHIERVLIRTHGRTDLAIRNSHEAHREKALPTRAATLTLVQSRIMQDPLHRL